MTAPVEDSKVDMSWVTFSEDDTVHWTCCDPLLALCGEVLEDDPTDAEVTCKRCIQLQNMPCHFDRCKWFYG